MTLEAWLAFAATATAFLLMPHPLASLTATFSVSLGRASGFVSVPAMILAVIVSAIPATAIAFAITFFWPGSIEAFSWAGLAYLMLYVLYAYQDPQVRVGLADNDNLPETRPFRIVGHVLLSGIKRYRYLLLSAALAVQVVAPASPPGEQYMQIVSALAAAAGVAALAYAIFPQRLMRRRRRRPVTPHALHKPGTRFIARRAVSAGYRRIAA